MIPFKGNSRKDKTIMIKNRSQDANSQGVRGKGFTAIERRRQCPCAILDCGGGYGTVYICQNSLNCTLKIGELYSCKSHLNKTDYGKYHRERENMLA